MPKFLTKIVVLLLAPCLAADPAIASVILNPGPTSNCFSSVIAGRYEEAALGRSLDWMHSSLLARPAHSFAIRRTIQAIFSPKGIAVFATSFIFSLTLWRAIAKFLSPSPTENPTFLHFLFPARHFHSIFPRVFTKGSWLWAIDHNWLNDFLYIPAAVSFVYLVMVTIILSPPEARRELAGKWHRVERWLQVLVILSFLMGTVFKLLPGNLNTTFDRSDFITLALSGLFSFAAVKVLIRTLSSPTAGSVHLGTIGGKAAPAAHLVTISSQSGAGGTTLLNHLLEQRTDFVRQPTYTTRQPRPGEVEGRDYYFVADVNQFKKLEQEGKLVAPFLYDNEWYGIPTELFGKLAKGQHVAMALEIQALPVLRSSVAPEQMTAVLVTAPRYRREQAHANRPGKKDAARTLWRLDQGDREEGQAGEFDHHVKNEDLPTSEQRIIAIAHQVAPAAAPTTALESEFSAFTFKDDSHLPNSLPLATLAKFSRDPRNHLYRAMRLTVDQLREMTRHGMISGTSKLHGEEIYLGAKLVTAWNGVKLRRPGAPEKNYMVIFFKVDTSGVVAREGEEVIDASDIVVAVKTIQPQWLKEIYALSPEGNLTDITAMVRPHAATERPDAAMGSAQNANILGQLKDDELWDPVINPERQWRKRDRPGEGQSELMSIQGMPPSGGAAKEIILSVEQGVATIVLNRPPVNAWSIDMFHQLTALAEDLRYRADVRVIILKASGVRFGVGGDIGMITKAMEENGPGALDTYYAAAFDMYKAFEELNHVKPIVTFAHGTTVGGHLGLAMTGLLVVTARPDAKYAMPEVRLSMFPDAMSTYRLPRRVGLGFATYMGLTGYEMSGIEARQRGLADLCLKPEDFSSAEEAIKKFVSSNDHPVTPYELRGILARWDINPPAAMPPSIVYEDLFARSHSYEEFYANLERVAEEQNFLGELALQTLRILGGTTIENGGLFPLAVHVTYFMMRLNATLPFYEAWQSELSTSQRLVRQSMYVAFVRWILHDKRDPARSPPVPVGVDMPYYMRLVSLLNISPLALGSERRKNWEQPPPLVNLAISSLSQEFAGDAWDKASWIWKKWILMHLYRIVKPEELSEISLIEENYLLFLERAILVEMATQMDLGLLAPEDLDRWIAHLTMPDATLHQRLVIGVDHGIENIQRMISIIRDHSALRQSHLGNRLAPYLEPLRDDPLRSERDRKDRLFTLLAHLRERPPVNISDLDNFDSSVLDGLLQLLRLTEKSKRSESDEAILRAINVSRQRRAA
jgi:enoyl-CoA hydratase/carnithine racemase/guanylate kinase